MVGVWPATLQGEGEDDDEGVKGAGVDVDEDPEPNGAVEVGKDQLEHLLNDPGSRPLEPLGGDQRGEGSAMGDGGVDHHDGEELQEDHHRFLSDELLPAAVNRSEIQQANYS